MSAYVGVTGGCQCGSVRYHLNEDPLALYVCHCRHCQKQSSSAFGMSMWMDRGAVEFTAGKLSLWSTRGDGGAEKICAFCANCGTPIYHAVDDGKDILSIKAGSLDDTRLLQPTCHLWTKRQQPWLKLDAYQDSCYETKPPDDETLLRRWSSAISLSSGHEDA